MPKDFEINQEILRSFKSMMPRQRQGVFGYNPQGWFRWILENALSGALPNEWNAEWLEPLPNNRVSREHLYDMVADSEIETAHCSVSILAWGGMRRNNGMTAFANPMPWLDICDNIRNNNLSRKKAFRLLATQRANGSMKGMGPAFFTKLIFFFMHNKPSPGYIMDQWTAASVNLLTGEEIVLTNRGTARNGNLFETVSDRNTEENYDQFCRVIESVADQCGADPVTTELAMFSNGGHNRGQWREFVINQRNNGV